MKITCLVIDDEHLAREYIKNYISKVPELELLGDFNSPLKANELIKSGKVDLLFLDIQMSDISGIDFIKTLNNPPEVIFTTAYQEYALEGFNLNAIDYLLKPFAFDRFYQAVNKAIDKIESNKTDNNNLTTTQPQTNFRETYITIRADRKIYKINYTDIKYIEGQKAYVTFHTAKNKITALASLKELEDSLPNNQFIRIHKSYIVAISSIFSLEGNMLDIEGVKLPIGKNYKDAVLKIFGIEEGEK